MQFGLFGEGASSMLVLQGALLFAARGRLLHTLDRSNREYLSCFPALGPTRYHYGR